MIFYKQHAERNGVLIAACDEDICGKTLNEGELEFFVNPRFYKEKRVTEKQLIGLLRSCSSANLVGEKAVSAGIKAGIVDEISIKKIAGIPHAQFVMIRI
jgi:hypothetical protein